MGIKSRALCVLSCATLVCQSVAGQTADRSKLSEPLYRVSNSVKVPAVRLEKVGAAGIATGVVEEAPHPLDQAIAMARSAHQAIDQSIRDYTCTLVKRERIGGTLLDHEYMYAKIRQRQEADGKTVVPFSVYLKFLKPASVKGREVIYVEGQNGGNLIAKEAGITGRLVGRVDLPPGGMLAMRNNRYPITEVGIETLVRRLIEKGERDRAHGECDVQFFRGAKIKDRTCTCLEVIHPTPRAHFDFYKARVFIDDELNVPIRYEAYTWPRNVGGEPELTEEYTYLNMKFNVGLTDSDFSPDNPRYGF